jgi:hypothetical protein
MSGVVNDGKAGKGPVFPTKGTVPVPVYDTSTSLLGFYEVWIHGKDSEGNTIELRRGEGNSWLTLVRTHNGKRVHWSINASDLVKLLMEDLDDPEEQEPDTE